MTKDLVSRLLDVIEELCIENRAYVALLHELHSNLPPEGLVKRLLWAAQEEAREQVQKEFSALREHIRQSNDLEQALQECLRVVPAKKDVN